MPPKRRNSHRSNESNNNDNSRALDPTTLNAVNQAVASAVAQPGIAGTKAGDAEEQAQKFKWVIDVKYRRDLVNFRKMGREDHYRASDRHGRFHSENNRNYVDRPQGGQSGQWQGQRLNQNKGYDNGQGQGNNYGPRTQDQGRVTGGNDTRNPNTIPIPPCAKCGRNHPGKPSYPETGQCFSCGQMGHMAKDYTSQQNVNRSGGGNN
ncbi:putative reverse transcriptase domain-containing protein [Tanacetum coccineum]